MLTIRLLGPRDASALDRIALDVLEDAVDPRSADEFSTDSRHRPAVAIDGDRSPDTPAARNRPPAARRLDGPEMMRWLRSSSRSTAPLPSPGSAPQAPTQSSGSRGGYARWSPATMPVGGWTSCRNRPLLGSPVERDFERIRSRWDSPEGSASLPQLAGAIEGLEFRRRNARDFGDGHGQAVEPTGSRRGWTGEIGLTGEGMQGRRERAHQTGR